jgi:cob(I)alamin adenosyltransferase
VPKRKKPGPYRVPPREQRHGLLIVNTGDGKGKTTAALGLLLRAVGRSMRVGMFQFMKAAGITEGGEYAALRRLGVEIVPLGAGCALGVADTADDQALATAGWNHCRVSTSRQRDVLVLLTDAAARVRRLERRASWTRFAPAPLVRVVVSGDTRHRADQTADRHGHQVIETHIMNRACAPSSGSTM